MKIAHITPSLGRGGAERFVVDLCNEMAKITGVTVYLLSLKDNDVPESFISELAREVHYISFGKNSGFNPKTLLSVSKWIDKIKPDVVNTHINAFEYINLNVFFKFPARITYFHTLHTQAAQECPISILKMIRSHYYKKGRVVPITISGDGKKTFKEYYGISNDVTIVNGRPPLETTPEFPEIQKRFSVKENEYLLLNVGRVVEVKNQEMLVRAVQMFNQQISEKKCRLLIIGDLREQKIAARLQSLIEGDPYIEMLGAKDNIVDYLSIADAFCMSSLYEGMPISLIEALSLGCIPICTPVGGMPEMITDQVNGFFSTGVTETAFFEAIKAFHYFAEKQKIAENCVDTFLQKYHIRSTAEKYLGLYKQKMKLQ
ncbi:glycosyltransferase family 4 protein [Dyadobacter sediminis]|uniref:Glycosyltransferase family 4 protein n=1 Tax=Dyadobacter sediminis TaxID=1493691 RepID=A0A5R9K961_9BACT|nr:glycosyltransferase family 4 protein [Dyadobacter sediminis]TLU90636.1 glycosyltransferase family 4 protein [Dyadobacter sediminis]GGC09460.1 glucosyl transferase [Dyadobacter sediminis]